MQGNVRSKVIWRLPVEANDDGIFSPQTMKHYVCFLYSTYAFLLAASDTVSDPASKYLIYSKQSRAGLLAVTFWCVKPFKPIK